MADGVDITAGSGTTILTDDTGATGHAQVVKIAYSADGSPTLTTVDADGVLVNLGANNDVTVTGTVTANLAAGTNNIGDVDVLTVPAPLSTTGGGAEATALRVTLANDSTGVVSVDDNGASLTIDGSVALEAGTNNIGDVDVLTVPAPLSTTGGGTEAAALRVTIANDSTGVVSVDDNGSSLTVDGSVTVTQSTAANLNAQVVGPAADDAAISGNPVSVGLHARTTNRTAVADGDVVRAMGDKLGRTVTAAHQVRALISHQHTQIASSSAETTIATAGGAGVFHDLISLVLTNQTATAVNVTLRDSTAGTTRMIIALAPNGGAVITPSAPIPQLAAANNNWTAQLSNATTTVNVFAQFAKNV